MRPPVRLIRHLAARGLLALAFLFAQQTAALHWLSHSIEATRSKAAESPATPAHCDDCAQFAALGAGVAACTPSWPAVAAEHVLLPRVRLASARAPPRLAFRSRAPPIPV